MLLWQRQYKQQHGRYGINDLLYIADTASHENYCDRATMDNSTGAVSCAELRKRRKAEYDREYRKRLKTNNDKSGARKEQLARHAAYSRLYRARKKKKESIRCDK
jgi:predicted nucleic acid-binding protein